MQCRLFAFVLLLTLLPSSGFAEDLTFSTTIKDAKKGTVQEVNVWVPGDVDVVRGVVINPGYAKLTSREDYQKFARTIGFALMGAGLDRTGDMPAAVTQALEQAADELKHPELRNVPLAFGGFSAGGGQAIKLEVSMPARDSGFSVTMVSDEAGLMDIALAGEVPEGTSEVVFMDGEREVGKATSSPWQVTVRADQLEPVAAIFAVAVQPDGFASAVSNPVSWVRGTPPREGE